MAGERTSHPRKYSVNGLSKQTPAHLISERQSLQPAHPDDAELMMAHTDDQCR